MAKTKPRKKDGCSRVEAGSSRQLSKSTGKAQVNMKVKKYHTKRGGCLKWLPENMAVAVSEVMNGKMSQRQASKVYGVPCCTLHNRVRVTGKTQAGARPGHPTTLEFTQEQKLVDYAGNRASLGKGFGKQNFLSYAKQFAEKHGAQFKKGVPSDQWWSGLRSVTQN